LHTLRSETQFHCSAYPSLDCGVINAPSLDLKALNVALTVSGALELEIFRRADAQVVAGHDHLDRVVRWVHAAEIPDIAKFLTGGEILLTAGLGLGSTEAQQRDYVRSLARAEIAVLVVELSGRMFTSMPTTVIEEADACGLPVVAISEIPFVEVSAQVQGTISDLRVAELLQDEVISEAFTELLLHGSDYLTIVAELADRIGHAVVLEDSAHVVLAYSGRSEFADTELSEWSAHSRLSHTEADGAEGGLGCTRRPVVLRGELWGRIHVLHGPTPLQSSANYATGRAAAAVAITLLGERVSGARQSQRHGALINRLMLGDVTGAEFVQGALKLGRDMRNREFVVVVTGGEVKGRPFGEAELAASLDAIRAPWIAADTGESALAVIGVRPSAGDTAVVDAVGRTGARVGISRVVPANQLLTAVQQARDAFASTGRAGGADRLARFDDLGVLRLLILLAQGPELANYVEDELGKLLSHDAASNNPMLPTLRAILDSDGRKTDAAKSLHVQRRTLYYRMERIESLLDCSLAEPETRQRLLLAIRGLDLLEKRSQRSALQAPGSLRNAQA